MHDQMDWIGLNNNTDWRHANSWDIGKGGGEGGVNRRIVEYIYEN